MKLEGQMGSSEPMALGDCLTPICGTQDFHGGIMGYHPSLSDDDDDQDGTIVVISSFKTMDISDWDILVSQNAAERFHNLKRIFTVDERNSTNQEI